MKKLFKNIFYLSLILISLNACQSVKDGLTGKKKSSSDEFMVEKKNPLVLPPKSDVLPQPQTSIKESNIDEEEIDLKTILTKGTSSKETISLGKVTNGSLEKSILEKIKSN